ncbi:dihydroneopterin aldolase [Parvularcula flava]|uniref:7,8-dihydroneopterin aldolase n=1 Tax=Aquisalinus luteolus TaxID=1566827 RepID=A0ABX0HGG0_9PROT|nr:dihydroneopterin aldolase [Aquisalinus luteolus]
MFVRGLKLDANIGAYESEMGRTQPVVISLEVEVQEPADPVSDSLEDVVCYNRLVQTIREILTEGHIKLVETLAERIAAECLAHPMSLSVKVRVEKPEAIEEADAAGVEITRTKRLDQGA